MTYEDDALMTVAGLMALAARTAPKGKGVDTISVHIATGDEKEGLAEMMRTCGDETTRRIFLRDAGNVHDSGVVVLIGCRGDAAVGVNCGGCGYPTCAEFLAAVQDRPDPATPYKGPNCAIRMADLGIAVGSAVKTAQVHNADNRVMFTAGVAAIKAGMLGDECTVAYGIPLSATGKNIFFDRTFKK
jgi:uncharacterized ferredoxin-like protein